MVWMPYIVQKKEENFLVSKLSVILPAYNEQENIVLAIERISKVLEQANIPFELIFIDDGSNDDTWKEINQAAIKDQRVRGISFSRNFGKEATLFAGLHEAAGDCCLTMDCDLQHPPEYIPQMYNLWKDGNEVVEAIKDTRGKENPLYRLCARCFYGLITRTSGIDMAKSSDFKLLDRRVVDALLAMPERNTFYRALSSWVGFKTVQIPFKVEERTQGVSKWSISALVRYATNNITSFSSTPMQIVTVLGVITLLISIIMGVHTLLNKFLGLSLEGFTTVIIVQLFVGGVVMMSLGIIGHYIAKIYEEIKQRPRYIIAERCGWAEEQ